MGRIKIYLAILSAALAFIPNIASSQQPNCDKLKTLVNVVATDTLLQTIKGTEMVNKYGKEKTYQATLSLWDKEDPFMQSQYIKYDDNLQTAVYRAYFMTEGTPARGLTKSTFKMLRTCLGDGWVQTATLNLSGDTVYYLKNPANYAVASIWPSGETVNIDFYNGRHNAEECLYGNCDSTFGAKRYFNENLYNGTFINGEINGMGTMKFYTENITYIGAFLDGQIAGHGTVYNDKNQVVQSGIFFKGQVVTVDTTKKTCQYGDCQMGYGLKVVKNAIFIGNFYYGVLNGMGELIVGKDQFFGHYENNMTNGQGIFITEDGAYTFGNYVNGQPKGNYERDFADKTTREVYAADQTASAFDEDNILMRAGNWVDGGLTEYTDAAYAPLKNFAKGLRQFYDYRKTGYKAIRGEQNKLLKLVGADGFKSTAPFLGTYDTYISTDQKRHYFITVTFTSGTPDKTKWAAIYNKYYNFLDKSVGSRWSATTDDGAVDGTKTSATILLQNLFDKTKSLKLTMDAGGVKMEIH